MRRDQIANERQRYLVPALGYPLPQGLRQENGLSKAHAAIGRLQGTLKHLANTDMVTRTLARREAVMSSQIEGTHSDLHAVVESCDDAISIAEDLLVLALQWEQQLHSYRAHSATRRLPRFLIGHPVLSVQQAAAGLRVSVPAANAGLNNLLAAGIVCLVDERQWGRVFQATLVLRRLDQPPAPRQSRGLRPE